MQRTLLGTISVDDDATGQLPTIYSALIIYLKKVGMFTDFGKVYDLVRREALYNILIKFGIPMKLVKVKVSLTDPKAQKEVEAQLYSFLISALERGGWPAPRPGRFTPVKDPVPIVQEAGWAPGPVLTCAKNLAPTGIFLCTRSPDRPARSQSLYRLSYPGPYETS
jgi:hypothetical protein